MTEKAIRFENHFAKRVMEVFFPDGYTIETDDDLKYLKQQWMGNLKNWHSPYTCIFDVRNFRVVESKKSEFEKLIQFFSKFFMKKTLGFSGGEAPSEGDFPFSVYATYDEAIGQTALGREGGMTRNLQDLRSRIQIDNDFNAHVMEISFLADTIFESASDVSILRAKVQNILHQWHSPYSVLINCVNCTFSDEARAAFLGFEKFLRAFFCKDILGYAPKGEKSSYPFRVLRSRHLAAAELGNNGIESGAVANCSTRKSKN